jgi:hypothetical protein
MAIFHQPLGSFLFITPHRESDHCIPVIERG